MPRDYRQEYDSYHRKPKAKKKRAAANRARKKLGLKKGDKRDAGHVTRSGEKARPQSRKSNRSHGGKVGNKAGKAAGGRKSKPPKRK
jgi:hypothetical protein